MPPPEPIPDLLKAVNEASGKAFALWITFLTVGTYLAIAIGTTTHLQLLLAGPVKLPLLGVDLPLFAFYGFAPPLFVVLHLYVLMQLYLLARLLRLFDDEVRAAGLIEQDRRRIRGQLDKFVFTQYLIGAPQDRIVRLFLRMVVWLSFVVGPILLLLGFQLRFLPYHNVPVTYVHRVVLLLDIMLLLLFWPKISRSGSQPVRALHDRSPRWRLVTADLCGAALLAFSFFIATVPGEGVRSAAPPPTSGRPERTDQRVAFIPFSQTLRLPGERLVEPDEDKLSKLAQTLSLHDRDFRQADLMGADLRKSDLRDTNFSGAVLSGANLGDANLKGANLKGANMYAARLSGANLSFANLSGTNLNSANLRGANLSVTNLSGARLGGANLSGANLSVSNLSGAYLGYADLHDAKNLIGTQLDQACGTNAKLPEGLTLKPC